MFPSKLKMNLAEIEELIHFRQVYTFQSGRERLSVYGNQQLKILKGYKYQRKSKLLTKYVEDPKELNIKDG